MTQEEFIKKLEEEGYSYETQGTKTLVIHEGRVSLRSLTHLPPGVEFKNVGGVSLDSLTHLPSGVEFKNEGGVYLPSLTHLAPGVEFKNEGWVYLRSLTHLPPGVEFKNEGGVWLSSLGLDTDEWVGNIEGIEGKRLLNLMIKRGAFK
jgi:hypothetical protein